LLSLCAILFSFISCFFLSSLMDAVKEKTVLPSLWVMAVYHPWQREIIRKEFGVKFSPYCSENGQYFDLCPQTSPRCSLAIVFEEQLKHPNIFDKFHVRAVILVEDRRTVLEQTEWAIGLVHGSIDQKEKLHHSSGPVLFSLFRYMTMEEDCSSVVVVGSTDQTDQTDEPEIPDLIIESDLAMYYPCTLPFMALICRTHDEEEAKRVMRRICQLMRRSHLEF